MKLGILKNPANNLKNLVNKTGIFGLMQISVPLK